ncbi:MAG TPA: hypothetical protein VJV22_10215, partial [Acidobacteriaceae bacterium]|nr:hypothetical protein [Acidobacteriaceae bacterium]
MFSRLSPITIFCATAIVAVGELAVGTRPEFVLAVVVIMVCAGLTFNMLDGFTSLAGILFSEFALRTIVISQFVKVALFERSDQNLEVPSLTIGLYATFYFCVMLSVFVLRRFRFPVPKPFEPVSDAHAQKLYVISFALGAAATVVAAVLTLSPTQSSTGIRTVSMQLSTLLLFAVVVAVDRRITNSAGRRSIGWDAVIPILLLQAVSFLATARESFLAPILVYYVYAYARGYRFGKVHFAFAAVFATVFLAVISPLYLFNKGAIGQLYFQDRVEVSLSLLKDRRALKGIGTRETFDSEAEHRFKYYSAIDNDVINRFALLRPDSDLISACAGEYRYGWTTVKIDVLYALLHFLYPNKPADAPGIVTGHVSGLNNDWQGNASTAFSGIADAYAGFGVLGVVLFGLFGLPLFLLVCRRAFDL